MTKEEVELALRYYCGYKPLSDSTLKRMTKDQLIGIIRCAEHNWACVEECNQRQYNMLMQRELLGKED